MEQIKKDAGITHTAEKHKRTVKSTKDKHRYLEIDSVLSQPDSEWIYREKETGYLEGSTVVKKGKTYISLFLDNG